MIKVTVNGQFVQIGSKVDLNPAIWDSKAGKAIGRSAQVMDINIVLDNFRGGIHKSYDKQIEDYGYVFQRKLGIKY